MSPIIAQNSVNLNQVFTIEKGSQSFRFKIIEHPYVKGYALIQDHPLIENNFPHIDQRYIACTAASVDEVLTAACLN